MIRPAARTAIRSLPRGVIALSFKSVYDELAAFRRLAGDRLKPESEGIFRQLTSTLEQISRSESGRRRTWKTQMPLTTISSCGEHQSGRCRQGRSLHGTLDFRWDIEPLAPSNHKHPLNRYFALVNSSVRVGLIDDAEGEVARWDFDLGDAQSPGCHFHAKFAEADERRRTDFGDIDVPRLPTFIFMPTDATEFMLGELWQDEWRRLSMSSTNEINEWRRYPQDRLCRMFKWHLGILETSKTGTPWAQLKFAKPEPDCFLDF